MRLQNKRAALSKIRPSEKRSTSKSKQFFDYQLTQVQNSHQCHGCRSDYMRFSQDGFCQWCLQRFEHESRELRYDRSEEDGLR